MEPRFKRVVPVFILVGTNPLDTSKTAKAMNIKSKYIIEEFYSSL
jgi:hypothetical protein